MVFSRLTKHTATVITIALALTWSNWATSQSTSHKADLTKALEPFSQSDGPGFAISVVYQGQPIFTDYYGMASLEYGIPISEKTLFDIASVSKSFTGYLVALLVEDDKIDLNKSIRHYLPSLKKDYEPIKVRHLIHHSSGLWDWSSALTVSGFNFHSRRPEISDVINLLNSNTAINFAAGEQISYTNTGYTLLAGIIEKATGKSFEETMKDRILQPLEMLSTHFLEPEVLYPQLATSYIKKDDQYTPMARAHSALGSSAMLTTIQDLTQWLINYHEVRVGHAKTHELTQERGRLNDGTVTNYGFGLGMASDNGHFYLGHDGRWTGFRSLVRHYPDQELSIAILCNSICDAAKIRHAVVTSIVKMETDSDNNSLDHNLPLTNNATGDAKRYTGVYRMLPGWFLWINEKDGQLTGRQWLNGYFNTPISINSDGTLQLNGGTATLTFHDKDETITHSDALGKIAIERLDTSTVSPSSYRGYIGTYINKGLGAMYQISNDDGQLIISNSVHGKDTLTPINTDYFLGSGQFIAEIRFLFNHNGDVVGINSSSERLRDVHFKKVE